MWQWRYKSNLDYLQSITKICNECPGASTALIFSYVVSSHVSSHLVVVRCIHLQQVDCFCSSKISSRLPSHWQMIEVTLSIDDMKNVFPEANWTLLMVFTLRRSLRRITSLILVVLYQQDQYASIIILILRSWTSTELFIKHSIEIKKRHWQCFVQRWFLSIHPSCPFHES